MPSILTHYGFNKTVFDEKIEFLKNNEDIYLVGAQGPDPFFFYGVNPFLKAENAKVIRKYGTVLHKMDPSEVFAFFFYYANDFEEKDILYSYILGAGMHYILDRKIHPYVFYKTGFSSDPKKKRKHFVYHTLFETNLDVLLMDGVFNKYKVKPFDSIDCDDEKIEVVSEMYECLAKHVVKENKIDDESFKRAYEHMCSIEKILYGKSGIKKKIAEVLFKNTPFNTMMHPKKVKDDEKIDYLNLKNNEWEDPCLEKVYTKSVIDLIEEASEEAKEWVKIVNCFYYGIGKANQIKKFTNNYIYDGYEVNKKMKVYENVFEKGEKRK